ncbi:(2Fe-2S)-binding protein [Arthrobacter gandavensis]|uniref:DUF2231 domain-containing protein n=1 Tax=Arthrobacter gandavensis TaxID=169960 RepID=UPI00189087AD|nr:DUF2231 domain-containing protein [Arthrobacter gandavensis]MBF4994943.1 (2Fe-2S)-binding protein [Arthrobacter gandavensis]
MKTSTVSERVVKAVGESPASEGIARSQEYLYGPILRWVRGTPFNGHVAGHSLHPVLTDLPLGCWLSATVLDLVGGVRARRSATLLVAAGLCASVPTALAGANDWTALSGADRRIGGVHALGTDAATILMTASLAARLRGRHRAGVLLGLAANVSAAAAGFLGGYLALSRGVSRR